MPVSEERYEEKQFVLDVPLDSSLIGADADGQELRVVARHADGCLSSKTVRVQPGEHASVRFHFDESPGPLQLLVGPATATESDVVRHQTLSVDVRGRQWSDTSRVSLEPIALTPYYWWWWLDWFRRLAERQPNLIGNLPHRNVGEKTSHRRRHEMPLDEILILHDGRVTVELPPRTEVQDFFWDVV